jgi:hypothetical protein
MNTFQQLSSYLSSGNKETKTFKKLLESSWLKVKLRAPAPSQLSQLIRQVKEAISDAQHFSSEGEQEYFDELIQRDLAS